MELVIPLSCGKLGHMLGDMEKAKFKILLSDRRRHDCRKLIYVKIRLFMELKGRGRKNL